MDKLSSKGAMVEEIRLGKVPTSGFDRANHNYSSGKLGKIIPTRFDEIYPGDRIKGSPTVVANFEPLVAPIMGSMVMKQESFFIPYPQVWKNAHKFFTEKKGFNTPMPSISPYSVYQAYADDFELLPMVYVSSAWHDLALSIYRRITHDEVTIAEIINYADDILYEGVTDSIISFGDTYFVRDLLQPVIDIYDKALEKWTELKVLQSGGMDQKEFLTELATIFDDLRYGVYNYYFGASSLFDYLGFPMPADFRTVDVLQNESDFWDGESVHQLYNLKGVVDFGYYHEGDSAVVLPTLAYNDDWSVVFSRVPLNWTIFRAYYLVWYWNYRDQLLEQNAYDPEEDDFLSDTVSPLNVILCSLLRVRCWFKDSFTTALTNTGSGNFSVPASNIGAEVEIEYYDNDDVLINTKDANEAINAGAAVARISLMGNGDYIKVPMNYLRGAFSGSYDSTASSSFNAVSLDLFDRIKHLRSFTQKHLINGYEYDDVIWASWEVRVSNVRMHIPEILSTGRASVDINTVVNNTTTTEQIAGDKSAIAFARGSASDINYFAEEWGLYIQNMTIMPIQSYPFGMQRFYLKRDRLDFAWPEFAQMGMDAVYNCELLNLNETMDDEGLKVFGYQGRYYDLKTRQDEVHGRMRTDLKYYVFGREFDKDNLPKLNYIFVHCWPSLDMFVVNDPTQDIFKFDSSNGLAFQRKLPVASEIIG